VSQSFHRLAQVTSLTVRMSWTRKVENKTVTRTLTPDQAEGLQPLLDNARRLRELTIELKTSP
jgi:hypothetical protein